MDKDRIRKLELICHEVRRRVFSTILNAGSGHLGGSSSSVELMTSLYFGGVLNYDPKNPYHPQRDRVLVRGHLGPLRYSIFSMIGWVCESELMTYRAFGSRLQGHESMELVPGVDITPSGSLGMILSYGVGCAFALEKQHSSSKVYVFLGDGEEQEGNVSEAARYASNIGLKNIICIIDKNGKQLSSPTSVKDSGADIEKIWNGYGWKVKTISNGHSIAEIVSTLRACKSINCPTVVIANTIKGYGLYGSSGNSCGYHTLTSCPKKYVVSAISDIEGQIKRISADISTSPREAVRLSLSSLVVPPVAEALVKRTKNLSVNLVPGNDTDFDDVFLNYCRDLVSFFRGQQDYHFYIMTADWIPKKIFRKSHFGQKHIRYVDVGIREQHLLAMAHGISITDPMARIMIICGDAFVFRLSDQLNAVAQAKSKMIIVGTDSGLCESRNGSTHQSTGQPGMLVSMPGMTMLEPADATDLYGCFNWALTNYSGPVYIRLHSTNVERFDATLRNIKSYVAYQPTNRCRAVLVGSGFVLDNLVKLAMRYDVELGIGLKVVNIIDMGHLDHSFVKLLETDIPVLAVYNGNPFILQSSIANAVMENKNYPRPSIIKGHGFTLGTTGKIEDILRHFHLDLKGIESVLKKQFSTLL